MGPRLPTTTRPPRPRRGPIAAARRWSACAAAAASIAVVLAWGVGVAFNDRFLWSQWLWWIPTAPAAIAAVVALIGSRLLDRHAARTIRRLALGATALVLVALATEARPHGRFLGPTPDPHAPTITGANRNQSRAE